MGSQMESEIAQTLDVSKETAEYDASAKKLVAQKSILAYILKSTMDEFADVSEKQIAEELIEGSPQVAEAAVHQDTPDAPKDDHGRLSGSDRVTDMSTEDISVREGTVRYDIRFVVRVPHCQERIQIIVNLEIQNSDTPGYPIPKRGIYYGSRLISAQKGSVFQKQEYGKIQKVVSIWVCESTAVKRSDTINEYYIHEKNRRGDYREARKDYDLMRVIVMRLGSHGNNSEDNAIRLLSRIFSSELTAEEKKKTLSDEFHIDITTSIDEEVDRMCNLSTGILERGIEQGIERGIERGIKQGIERGIEQGREKGMMETLFNLVRKGLLTLTDAASQADMDSAVFKEEYENYCRK